MPFIKVTLVKSKGHIARAHIDEKCCSFDKIRTAKISTNILDTSTINENYIGVLKNKPIKICEVKTCRTKFHDIVAQQKYVYQIHLLKNMIKDKKAEILKLQNIIEENKKID